MPHSEPGPEGDGTFPRFTLEIDPSDGALVVSRRPTGTDGFDRPPVRIEDVLGGPSDARQIGPRPAEQAGEETSISTTASEEPIERRVSHESVLEWSIGPLVDPPLL